MVLGYDLCKCADVMSVIAGCHPERRGQREGAGPAAAGCDPAQLGTGDCWRRDGVPPRLRLAVIARSLVLQHLCPVLDQMLAIGTARQLKN